MSRYQQVHDITAKHEHFKPTVFLKGKKTTHFDTEGN